VKACHYIPLLTFALLTPAAGKSLRVGDEIKITESWTAGSPAAALGNGEYLVVWSDGSLGSGGTADIFGLRLDARSLKPRDANPIRIASAPGPQYTPTVAYSGGRFLVVWEDFRAGRNTAVFGAVVEGGTGNIIRSDVEISVGEGNRARPDVAPLADGFLVVWQQIQDADRYAVYGTRVLPDGRIPEAPVVFGAAGARPKVAVSGSRGLVAWSSGNYQGHLEARLVELPSGRPGRELGNINSCCQNDISLSGDGKGSFWVLSSREAFPNPWGWPGPGAVTFSRVLADGSTPEASLKYGPRSTFLSERKVPNVIDAATWGDSGFWNAGVVGGFPGTVDHLWPHGMATAKFDDGGTLLVVWVKGLMGEDRLSLSGFDVWARGLDSASLAEVVPPQLISGGDKADELRPLLLSDGSGGFVLLYQKVWNDRPRLLTGRTLRLE